MAKARREEISIIIPAYNEAAGISEFLVKLIDEVKKHKGYSVEIIVVNDGSTDTTGEEATGFEDVRVIAHKHNKGYGASLKTGIRASASNTIVIIDADNSYDIEDIFVLLKHFKENDMVVGVRNVLDHKGEFMRRMARRVFRVLANFLTQESIPDLNSGLRVMDKTIVNKYMYLLPEGFSFTTTITVAMLTDLNYVHFEPVKYHPRTGSSKISPVMDFSRFIYLILTTILCFKPVRVFMPIAFIFFLASIFVLLFSYFYFEKVMDITTVLLFLSGTNFFAIGLIAELIVRLSKKNGT
jgi:glycosyltransferase involved in cell wall biosynthesis